MSDFKQPGLNTDDVVTIVGAMAGVWVNNPEQAFLVRLAITEAQQEICSMQSWKWMKSTGYFKYTTNASTFNMLSVSAGKYKAFNQFDATRLGRDYDLNEVTPDVFERMRLCESTSAYPRVYMRLGETSFRWQPVPTQQHSVHFTFTKRPGFVQGNEDIIIPRQYVLNCLCHLARRKVWEMKGDARSGQGDSTYALALAALRREEYLPVGSFRIRAWNPCGSPTVTAQSASYSGFYSTGNMP